MRHPRVDMEGMAAIVAIAEVADIVKAAQLLNVGASAMLKRLAKAEDALQTRIFRKTRNMVVLTTDGRIYFREASCAIEHAVLGEEKVAAALRLREKHLLVGYSTYLPARLLTLLARLNGEDVPGMSIQQKSGLSHEIESDVANSVLHVGIGFLPVSHPHLSVHQLVEEPVVLCVPAGHPLATKSEIRPEDLKKQPIIAVGRRTLPAFHEEIAEFYRGFDIELNIVADAFAPSEALCLAEQRVGVCFLGRSTASLNRSIVTRPLSTGILTRKCGVFYHEANDRPLVRRFVALIRVRIKQARL